MTKTTNCGFVAIIGRPNVGKSTLLNHLLGQKISIISHKPQTTRQRILGIQTTGKTQTIYVDTPGLHQEAKAALNRYLNKAALTALRDVDVIVWVIEALQWRSDDTWVLKKLNRTTCPVVLVINKVDKVADKTQLLPFIEEVKQKFNFAAVIPLAALKGDNVAALEKVITQFLPEGPFLYPKDQITDRSERFMAAEVIREKLLWLMHQEVPHSVTVSVEEFKQTRNILRIIATIWVEKPGQKAIIIGAGGLKLKEVGKTARLDLEKMFGQKIFLQLWVKIRKNWSNDERAMRSLGYED